MSEDGNLYITAANRSQEKNSSRDRPLFEPQYTCD